LPWRESSYATKRRPLCAAGPRRRLPRPATPATDRRTLLKGFAFGAAFSGAIAASALFVVVDSDRNRRVLGDVVSAHLRSLQSTHLTDVESNDQDTVKPWFNGKLDVAPPVVDLTAKGFTLLGGRLDYLDGRAVAVIVYRRRRHMINLFVEQGEHTTGHAPSMATVQGFNVRRWTDHGLDLWAVSDISAEELAEFGSEFDAALQPHDGT
jgi:anti-sigma factor RsiW